MALMVLSGCFLLVALIITVWTPMASLLGIAGPVDPRRAHDIVNAYTVAFFDRHVYGRPAGLLDGPAPEYPDADFESHVP